MVDVRPRSILLVDDDQALLDSLAMVVETMAAGVAIKARGLGDVQSQRDEAVACDSAIIDINLGLGEPTGVDVYRWLRSSGFGHKPITFLTGHAKTHPDIVEASRLGDCAVYSKPIDMDLFLKIAQTHG